MNNLTLYENLLSCNKNRLNKEALYYQNKSIKFKTLFEEVEKIASYFVSLGLKENDFITIVAPNIPEALYCFMAGNKLGLRVHLLHPLISLKPLKEELDEKHSKLLITLDIFSTKYEELLPYYPILLISPSDSLAKFKQVAFKLLNKKSISKNPKFINYSTLPTHYQEAKTIHFDNKKDSIFLSSGGTTGKSKTIMLSDYAIYALITQADKIIDKKYIDDHYMLAVLPMFHGFGLVMGVLTPLYNNARVSMVPQFHTLPVIKLIKKNKANILIGVPLIYEALLSKKEFDGDFIKNINLAFIGGDFISPSLLKRFNDHLKKHNSEGLLLEGYGLTETVTVCNVNTLKNHKDRTVGKPLSIVSNYIIDENNNILPPNTQGEIALGGETLMNGYYLHDVSKDFITLNGEKCVKTGDLGYIDEEGYLYFVSRAKNVIKHKGFNIYPLMIEKKVSTIDFVKECSYTSLIINELETPVLYLSLNSTTLTEEEIKSKLKSYIKEEFADYCIPERIYILDSLPHTNVGKIDVVKLKNTFNS